MIEFEDRDGVTFMSGGFEITTNRQFTEKLNSNKLKQFRDMKSGDVCRDLLAHDDPMWPQTLGQMLNANLGLPNIVDTDPKHFRSTLIVPDLDDELGERYERGIENFFGLILRPPITRNQIDAIVDALHQDLVRASGSLTIQELRNDLNNEICDINEEGYETPTQITTYSSYASDELDLAAD